MGYTQGAQAVQGEVALPAAVSTGYEGEASALRLDDAKRSYHFHLAARTSRSARRSPGAEGRVCDDITCCSSSRASPSVAKAA